MNFHPTDIARPASEGLTGGSSTAWKVGLQPPRRWTVLAVPAPSRAVWTMRGCGAFPAGPLGPLNENSILVRLASPLS